MTHSTTEWLATGLDRPDVARGGTIGHQDDGAVRSMVRCVARGKGRLVERTRPPAGRLTGG
jgi:hypothetical protein